MSYHPVVDYIPRDRQTGAFLRHLRWRICILQLSSAFFVTHNSVFQNFKKIVREQCHPLLPMCFLWSSLFSLSWQDKAKNSSIHCIVSEPSTKGSPHCVRGDLGCFAKWGCVHSDSKKMFSHRVKSQNVPSKLQSCRVYPWNSFQLSKKYIY